MGSANLALGSKSDVGQTSASIRYGTWGWSKPADSTHTSKSETDTSITTTTTTISYGSLSYSWSFSDGGSAGSASGTHNFTGLGRGSKNTCTARVSVSVQKTTTVTTSTKPKPKPPKPDPKPDKPGKKARINEDEQMPSTRGSSSTWVPLGSASASITVYTRPGSWSWGFPADPSHSYIVNYITVSRWNSLVSHLGKYQSWNQQSSNYNSYSYLNVSSGEWIGAKKYNSMASACGISNRVVAHKTLITAAAFKALADAVST